MMDRRRFLQNSLAGALTMPLAARRSKREESTESVLLPLGVTPLILASFLAGMRDRG